MLATRVSSNEFVFPLGGQFLLDPNEANGWGILGPYDNTNTQDLGNAGAELNQLAGGVMFPFDVKLKRFGAWHRQNNTAAEGFGFYIMAQQKYDNSANEDNTVLLDEVDGAAVGPRDHTTTNPHFVDIDLTNGGAIVVPTIASGLTVHLSVVSPTADATNRYVQIMSGYFLFERVS